MHSKQPTTTSAINAEQASGFDELGLAAPLRAAVLRAGYTTPTPIQIAAIPRLLRGGDLIGCAQTGTGKTAAFALPILHRLLEAEEKPRPARIRALVLAPTRELAAQIAETFQTFGARTSLRTTVVFGGVKKGAQVRALSGRPAILVATPGRLLDLLSDRALSLAEVEYVVLDEADRMLDMGFIHDVRRILKTLPTRRQTLLFSATMPREIESLAAQFLDRPERVAAEPVLSSSAPINQTVHFVEKQQKTDLLIRTLSCDEQALVFTRTKHGANKVVKQLGSAGIAAAAIHGNKSQAARESALASFKSGRTRIVVATDLASRGIDIKELPLVINFDLPNEPEVYVHRIGRTGRAGASGTALSFCSREELPFLSAIEKLTRQRIERVGSEPSASAPVDSADDRRTQHAGGFGGRGERTPSQRSNRQPGRRATAPEGASVSRHQPKRAPLHRGGTAAESAPAGRQQPDRNRGSEQRFGRRGRGGSGRSGSRPASAR